MANPTLERARGMMANTEGTPLVIFAAGLTLCAGILHFLVAPDHFGEHIAQGLFMAVLGTLQVVWALWFFRRPSAGGLFAGLALTLGSLVVWIIAITYRAPYQSDAEPASAIAYTTKIIEALAMVALLAIPLSRARALGGVTRALPLVVIILLVGALAGAGAFGAGLVGEHVAPGLGDASGGMSMGNSGSPAITPASTSAAPGEMSGMPMSANNTTAPANTSSSGSSADSLPPGFDGSNCMGGMDMPGCTAAQAAKYYAQQAAAPPPPPDKVLPNVKIAFDPQGNNAAGAFSVPDAGVKQLLVSIRLNDSGMGPYIACGVQCQGDIKVTLAGKVGGASIPLTSGAIQGVDLGSDPTGTGNLGPVSKGPWNTNILAPSNGDWTIALTGMGQNAHIDVQLTERFWS